MQKGINFIDNSVVKEFHLRERKLHLNKKGVKNNGSVLSTESRSFKRDILALL